jgi:hypothetical protein
MAALEDALKLLGLSAPFAYAAGAYAFFHWLDDHASDAAKTVLARTLKQTTYNKTQAATALVEVFDRVYTRPLFHWRAFVRSILITCLITAIYLVEQLYLGRVNTAFLFDGEGPTDILLLLPAITGRAATDPHDQLPYVLLTSLLVNVVSDYISLFLIRRWLMKGGSRLVLSLFVASIIGTLVVISAVVARLVITLVILDTPIFMYVYMIFLFLYNILSTAFLLVPAIVVFSWLPLFGLAILVLRAANSLFWAVQKMQWFMKNGQDHPLDAVGYIAGAIVFVIASVWHLFFEAPSPGLGKTPVLHPCLPTLCGVGRDVVWVPL